MNLSNFIFEEQSFIDSKRTPAHVCVEGLQVCEEDWSSVVLRCLRKTNLKHVPHSALGQVEPAPVGLRGVHLLRLWGLLLRWSDC